MKDLKADADVIFRLAEACALGVSTITRSVHDDGLLRAEEVLGRALDADDLLELEQRRSSLSADWQLFDLCLSLRRRLQKLHGRRS